MKQLLFSGILLICLSVFAFPVRAAEIVPNSIRDLIVIGLQKNIGLQVEKLNAPIAAETVVIEAAGFDPELFAAAEYSESSVPLSSSLSLTDSSDSDDLAGQIGVRKKFYSGLQAALSLDSEWVDDNNDYDQLNPRYRTGLNLTLLQPLLRNFGKQVNTTDLQLSQNRQQQVDFSVDLQAQTLALQIETLALQLASNAEIVKLREEAVGLSENLYAANRRRFDAGISPVSEVQEAETDLANKQLQLSLARQSLDLIQEELNRQLDFSLPAGFSADSIYNSENVRNASVAVNLPTFVDIYQAAQNKRMDLKISELEILNSSIQKTLYANRLLPQLDLQLRGGVNGYAGDPRSSTTPSYSGNWSDSFSGMADKDGYQWAVGVEFSVPLGNRSAEARYRQAELLQRQATYRQRDLEATLKQQIQQRMTVLQRTVEQFEISNRFQALAEKSLQQEQRRLEEGLSDTFRAIFFQNNMINAKIDRINALTQYHLAVAQMNYVRGIILEQYDIALKQITEEKSLETM